MKIKTTTNTIALLVIGASLLTGCTSTILTDLVLWRQSKKGVEIEEIIQNGKPPSVISTSSQASIALAKHLNKNGFKMYSAYWCPHCHKQKELFGKEAVKSLVIIECAKDGENSQHSLCETKGVTGYPSWEIYGELEAGVKSLSELAEISNYKAPYTINELLKRLFNFLVNSHPI